MKILKTLAISILLISCHNKQDKIRNIVSSKEGKKWYYYEMYRDAEYYPRRVMCFYPNDSMNRYLNGHSQKIPYDDMWNTEKWYIINDSVISISGSRNPRTGYYRKDKSKILYLSQDTIILQNHYKNIVILVDYNKYRKEIEAETLKENKLLNDKYQ